MAAVAPQEPQHAADDIRSAMGTLGLGGVLIASHTGGFYLVKPGNEPILGAIEETDATVYLHPPTPSPQSLGLAELLERFNA